MFTFLLIIHALVAASLVGVILIQRSEGGGLTSGGGNSGGLMSARGAADFLTRATSILGTIFIIMSIGLAALATMQNSTRTIDTSLARKTGTPAPAQQTPPANPGAVPLAK